MNSSKTIFVSAITALIVALLAVFLVPRGDVTPSGAETSTAYDRILSSQVIRAAYINYPPGCIVDPATGVPSGIFVDILDKIGENTGLKIEYTEEVGWATMISGLDAGRYDIMGSPVWANSVRGKLATLSDPAYYSGIGIWVRPDETRFTPEDTWASINRPNVKIAAMDGSTPMVIARTLFPEAEIVSYPDLTGEPQLFLDVTTGKADIFFAEPSLGLDFLATNPGALKNIAAEHPVKIFPNIFLMRGGEPRLKGMIDTALRELQNSGYVDQVLRKYEPGPNAFYRIARPYRVD